MVSEKCIFCKIIQGEIPCSKVYEDDNILSFLDINPWSQGHCLVIPKAHYRRLDECPEELISAITAKLGIIASSVVTAVGVQDYNLLSNNGTAAGQEVDHLHFHIIPRTQGDKLISHTAQGTYREGEIAQIAEKISKLLR